MKYYLHAKDFVRREGTRRVFHLALDRVQLVPRRCQGFIHSVLSVKETKDLFEVKVNEPRDATKIAFYFFFLIEMPYISILALSL